MKPGRFSSILLLGLLSGCMFRGGAQSAKVGGASANKVEKADGLSAYLAVGGVT